MRRLGLLAFAVVCLASPSRAAQDPVYAELAARSFPSDPTASSLLNPWGERLVALETIPADFGLRVATAAAVYNDQGIRFDGYVGSDDDGTHYYTAADGEDGAWYGDPTKKTYTARKNGVPDDLSERVWVCLDYPVHALSLAGFPIREAMTADWHEATAEYTYHGRFRSNRPVDVRFFRRVVNLQRYFQRQQWYGEVRVTTEELRSPQFRLPVPFDVGDVVFMGHYGDADKQGPWVPKHSGIVKTVDERGLPDELYNMRVSKKMVDRFDGVINHTREIEGVQVLFKRFSDRYSLVGHGRVVRPFLPVTELAEGQRSAEALSGASR